MIDSNVSPNWVDEEPNEVESVTVSLLIFNESFCVCLKLSDSWECTQEMGTAKSSGLEIVGIDVFSEVDCFCNVIGFFPCWSCFSLCYSKGWWGCWEFEVMEIKIISFFLLSSISLCRSNNIYCWVTVSIFLSKVEILSNFLLFSEISWFVELVFVSKGVNGLNWDDLGLLSRLRDLRLFGNNLRSGGLRGRLCWWICLSILVGLSLLNWLSSLRGPDRLNRLGWWSRLTWFYRLGLRLIIRWLRGCHIVIYHRIYSWLWNNTQCSTWRFFRFCTVTGYYNWRLLFIALTTGIWCVNSRLFLRSGLLFYLWWALSGFVDSHYGGGTLYFYNVWFDVYFSWFIRVRSVGIVGVIRRIRVCRFGLLFFDFRPGSTNGRASHSSKEHTIKIFLKFASGSIGLES